MKAAATIRRTKTARVVRRARPADRHHRYVGNPMAGSCPCGAPYASPIHHTPRGNGQ